MTWRLTVRDEFSAAHALRNYHGKCENTHGHNFSVEATVEGDKLDEQTGMLIDFGILKKMLAQILAEMDHKFLNETPPFASQNPSSENMARHICQQMRLKLDAHPEAAHVMPVAVSVSEKGSQTATWIAD